MKYCPGKIIFIILIISFFSGGCKKREPDFKAGLSVADALRGDNTEGYFFSDTIRIFSFPEDHGPHGDYRNEWWYYTGNVDTGEGRHFGFQVTFFRISLTPEHVVRKSLWGSKNLYMAHFALTDVKENRFYAFDRFSRDGLDLAGAIAVPFRVWLEDWYVEGKGQDGLPMLISASEDNISIDLTLSTDKPPVLQGDRGLSQKSSKPGNASYYYSFTRMDTEGTIKIKEDIFSVRGFSWMDREWSTSALDENQTGWDWFSLQLSDGSEVMFYQMRKNNGTIDLLSNGTFVEPDGSKSYLSLQDVELDVLSFWKTSDGSVTYPSQWNLNIPGKNLELEITPHISDQELNVTVRYWEGAVKVKGNKKGKSISGNGYVELTGYD